MRIWGSAGAHKTGAKRCFAMSPDDESLYKNVKSIMGLGDAMLRYANRRNIFCNQGVTGSSPVAGTNRIKALRIERECSERNSLGASLARSTSSSKTMQRHTSFTPGTDRAALERATLQIGLMSR